MVIWDIMGDKDFRELLREAYFYGAQGILAVCDLTRADSLEDLHGWIYEVFRTVGEVPVVIAVNKHDLEDHAAIGEFDIGEVADTYGAAWMYTSAKTGQNVESIFEALSEMIALGTRGRPEEVIE